MAIDHALSAEEQAVLDAARAIALTADPWTGLVQGGWLDVVADDPHGGLVYAGLVGEALGEAAVAVPYISSAVAWSLVTGSSCQDKKVGVITGEWCEDGVGAEVVLSGQGPINEFEAMAVGALDGDQLARVSVAGVGPPPVGDDVMRACAAVASCEMAGLIRATVDLTISYVREREQFGRPLSQFQVVQHHAADLSGFAAAATAAARLATHDPDPVNVHAAKAYTSSAAHEVSVRAHQMHGAIGFTEEYGLQRLTKRLRTLRFSWGDDNYHAERTGRLASGGGRQGPWP